MNCRTLVTSTNEVQAIRSHPYVRRLINRDRDVRAITEQLSVITGAIQSFLVASV
jgi:hypothetical protein